MELLDWLIPSLEHFKTLGYWIAFFAALLEATAVLGMLVPGSVVILFLGALSARGYLDVGDLIWFSIAGAVLGDNISYYLGKYGHRYFQKGSTLLNLEYVEKAENFIHNHGGKSVFLGRFIPGLRENIPVVAGLTGMDRKKFLFWNILGALGWSIEHVYGGYIFGQAWKVAETWLTRIGVFVLILSLTLILLHLVKRIIIKRGKAILHLLVSVSHSIGRAVADNADIRKLVRKHPRFFTFLRARFDGKRFFGLPSTLLAMAFIYVFGLFAGIIEDLIMSDVIVMVDSRLANLLASFRSPEIDTFFIWITLLGKWQIVLTFMFILSLLLWVWNQRNYIIPLWGSVIGAEFMTFLGKVAFHRPRPEAAYYIEHSFSFPSGHATITTAFYGFIIYVLFRNVTDGKRRANIVFAGFVIILFIGFSRLYLGVHYLSDVWAGYLIGSLWLIISIAVSEWWLSVRPRPDLLAPAGQRARLAGSTALIMMGISFYVFFALHYHPLLPMTSFPHAEIPVAVSDVGDTMSSEHIPLYTETITGAPQRPLSFIILAENDAQFISSFHDIGWSISDPVTVINLVKSTIKTFNGESYPTAPVAPSFWNSRVNDFSFEKTAVTPGARQRHYARFWKTTMTTDEGRSVYVGSAGLDTWNKWGVIHRTSPDVNEERESLFADLQGSGRVKKWKKISLKGNTIQDQSFDKPLITDGTAYAISF